MRLLHSRQAPTTVEDVAEGVGLHINTTREHLDRLVTAGFVVRQPERRTTRGRPRMLYHSVDNAVVSTIDSRARAQLVRLLIEGYGRALPSPATTAEEAGRAWAAELGCPGTEATGDEAADVEGQIAALLRHLEDYGFDPEYEPESLDLALRHCPFADVPSHRRSVACSAHLGLARGMLSCHEGPLVVDSLDVKMDEELCVLRLAYA